MDFEVELISFERQPHWQNEEPDKKIRHAGKACPSLQRLAQAFWRWLHRVQALQRCAMQNVCRISADLYATCLKGGMFSKHAISVHPSNASHCETATCNLF